MSKYCIARSPSSLWNPVEYYMEKGKYDGLDDWESESTISEYGLEDAVAIYDSEEEANKAIEFLKEFYRNHRYRYGHYCDYNYWAELWDDSDEDDEEEEYSNDCLGTDGISR